MNFQSTVESEWKDLNYTLNTDSLAWAFCDPLMDFLVHQGVVSSTSVDEWVELSTALEPQEYITLL